MRKMVGLALAMVAGASLTACSSNSSETQLAFDEMRESWSSSGFDLSATKLLTIEPQESYDCSQDERSFMFRIESDSPSIALYCPLQDAVVIAEDSYDKLNAAAAAKGISKTAVAHQVIGHELGHAIQIRKQTSGPLLEIELEADCYSGNINQKLYPDSEVTKRTEDIYSLYSKDGSETHGASQQRVDSFRRGQSGPC